MKKTKIFIGSSVESLNIARAIQENLDHDALCNVWDQGIFELSGNALDNLLTATEKFDVAIFVFMPNDITKIRDSEYLTVRDNLIFELGLFISRLGKERVFFIIPRNVDKLHLPTDILGVEPAHFEPPIEEKDLLASLGPFCNKIRRQLKELDLLTSAQVEKITFNGKDENIDSIIPSNEVSSKSKTIEVGITVDAFGNYKISIAPTVFFSYRMAKAFPGVRGLEWFTNPKEALDRLEILLKPPLYFEKAEGYGVSNEPIWWSRGYSDLAIRNFNRLNDFKCLMDEEELIINKIATYHSERYWQSFVYVEIDSDEPIGLYKYSKGEIEKWTDEYGYYREEYGLFDQNIPITRACYDDGAAVINGKVTDTSGAHLRIRFLTKYNFVITSRFSPIATRKFEKYSKKSLNDILKGLDTVENLVEFVQTLPKHEKDD